MLYDDETIARIVPHNDAAKTAFHNLALQNERGGLPEYHASSMCIEGFVTPVEPETSDSESDSDSSTRSMSPLAAQHYGYYALSVQTPPRTASTIGWRLGKGEHHANDTTVDILVISEACAGRARKSVGRLHASIQFNILSGLLVLVNRSETKSVVIHDDSGDITLAQGAQRALWMCSNLFWLGHLSFCLEYHPRRRTNAGEHFHQFLKARNAFISKNLADGHPHSSIPVTPLPDFERRLNYVIYNTIGAGTFGSIRPAIDVTTGNTFAIKQTLVRHRREVEALITEYQIGKMIETEQARKISNDP